MIDYPRKEFYAKNKKVWGHGVSLSNSSSGIKVWGLAPIYKDEDGGG